MLPSADCFIGNSLYALTEYTSILKTNSASIDAHLLCCLLHELDLKTPIVFNAEILVEKSNFVMCHPVLYWEGLSVFK